MYKWSVFFNNPVNNIKKYFTVKANSKNDAIQKAVKKCENHNLNFYDFTLEIN